MDDGCKEQAAGFGCDWAFLQGLEGNCEGEGKKRRRKNKKATCGGMWGERVGMESVVVGDEDWRVGKLLSLPGEPQLVAAKYQQSIRRMKAVLSLF